MTGKSPAVQSSTACGRRIFDGLGGSAALGQKVETLGQPVRARDHRGREQQQGEIAFDGTKVPGPDIAPKCGQHQGCENLHELEHQSSTCKMARNASCGTSTDPICFMRFLPAFCFSRSLRLRLTSPP